MPERATSPASTVRNSHQERCTRPKPTRHATPARPSYGLTQQAALDRFESAAPDRGFNEPLPVGRISVTHYQAVHHHIFLWAGRPRKVRISRGDSTFRYPEHISQQLKRVFVDLRSQAYLRGRDAEAFAAGAAHFLAEFNAVHPFHITSAHSIVFS